MKFHLEIELNVHVLAEAGGIVIAIGLRVTERLQHRIAANQFAVHLFHLLFMPSGRSNELQNLFGRLRFP